MAPKPGRIQAIPKTSSVFNYLKKDFKSITRANQKQAIAERNLFWANSNFARREEDMYKKIADMLLEFVSNDSVNPAAAQFLLIPVQEIDDKPDVLVDSEEKHLIDHLVRKSFRFSAIGVKVSRSNNTYIRIGVTRAYGFPEGTVTELAIKAINEEWQGLGTLTIEEDENLDAYKIAFLPAVKPDFLVQFIK